LTGTDIQHLSARDISRLTNSGDLTAEAVVRACLERIAAREDAVGAWAFLDPEKAIAQAKQVDRRPEGGALRGVPVGIKDIIATVDMPTCYGSPIYKNHRPAWDAACVASIRQSGGIIMGKTVTTEFASSYPGKTANPKDTERTPGGSSSGSAAAVADFMVPLAVGTQTGGSVIRPASFCGIVGYKPSFGLINRHGVKPLSESFDTVGVMARSVDDAALLAMTLMGRTNAANTAMIEPPSFAVWRNAALDKADGSTLAAFEEFINRAAEAGAIIEDVAEPAEIADLDHAHHQIEYFEMGQALLFEYQTHRDHLSTALRGRLEAGRAISIEQYDAMREAAKRARAQMNRIFQRCDAILYPSTLGEAPRGLEATGNALFNRFWTALYGPVITLPIGIGPSGMPLGVQLVGRRDNDARLLTMARWFEKPGQK